jgi:hypothetical protein
MEFNLADDLERLKSSDLETKIVALDKITADVSKIVHEAVNALNDEENAYFVAERLGRFGSLAIAPLEVVLQKSSSVEVQELAALVLARIGSKTGVPILLQAVLSSKDHACSAARQLAHAGISEAKDNLITRLRSITPIKPSDTDVILCLAISLKKLGFEIPADIVARFTAPDADMLLRLGWRQFVDI